MSIERIERVGRLLRVNGRYSLTHRFLTEKRDGGIATACGLVYQAGELYDGPEDVPIFEFGQLPGGWADCGECFDGGHGFVTQEVPQ